MGWAARRRFIILFILGAIAVAFLIILLISALYKTPSCTDGIQNQEEMGIDCGGQCSYFCAGDLQPPTVLFTKLLQNDGRTDIIAEVENKNTEAAAKNVPYRIALYGSGQSFLGELSGTLDLPSRTIVPVYVPGVVAGNQKIVSAFLEIETSAPQWFALPAGSLIVPVVLNIMQTGSASSPRIEATLANPSTATLSNVQAVVLVRDVRQTVIAASRTVVPAIPADGRTAVTFTWNNAFQGIPASIEVVSVISIP